MFAQLLLVDKEAFGKLDDQTAILKTFWKSESSRIIMARKSDTQSIIGYACFQPSADKRSCYLMRIGVRNKNQRMGIGKAIMEYLARNFDSIQLEVSSDNDKAVRFYERFGLQNIGTYFTESGTEFIEFKS